MIKRISTLILIFITGGIAFINLSYIKFGGPQHYDGGWTRFGIAIFLAIFFGFCNLALKEGK